MENNYVTVNVIYHLKQYPHTLGYGKLPSHEVTVNLSKEDIFGSVLEGKLQTIPLIKSKLEDKGIFWMVIDNPGTIKKTIEDRLKNTKLDDFGLKTHSN